MTTPVRLQLSRRKGFDLQALSLATNGLPAVNVARPTKWGNPWRAGITRAARGVPFSDYEPVADAETAVRFFREMLQIKHRNYPSDEQVVRALRGKNLACWCAPGDPCHADALLELANRPICEQAP